MPKMKKPTRKRTATKIETKTKTRRSPVQLLEDLKDKRQALAEKTEKKLSLYDSKIAQLESKYQQRIKVEELRAGMTPEDLERQLEELKEQQRLLKLAMKQK